MRRAIVPLELVNERVWHEHRSAPLGNKRDPLELLVCIQLSVRTREGACQRDHAALRRLAEGPRLTGDDHAALVGL